MLINLRNALMTGKKWKNPYITDGLVRQWDGEWNESGGVHNSTLQGWVDLVTGNLCPFSIDNQMPTWGSTYYENDRNSNGKYFAASVPDLATTDGSTIEVVVMKITDSRGTIFGAYGIQGGNNCNIEWQTGRRLRAYYRGNPDLLSPTDSFSFNNIYYFASTRSGSNYAIKNGNAQTLSSTVLNTRHLTASPMRIGCDSRTSSNCFAGNIYAIRAYDRALTDAEIAANYAIDKERFNLP